MKISKSKRQLAQLLIEAGVKQFPEGANWAAQDGGRDVFPRRVYFYRDKPIMSPGSSRWKSDRGAVHLGTGRIMPEVLIPNWHQTVLSRAEFDRIVAESAEQGKPDADGWIEWKGGERPVGADEKVDVQFRNGRIFRETLTGATDWFHTCKPFDIMAYRPHKPVHVEPKNCEPVTHTIPEPATAPTLDQLLQDYRNASDFAAAKQVEADEAAKMRDERWKVAQARACELGVHISVELVVDAEMRESEPVITDWRDLKIGDEIEVVESESPLCKGLVGVVKHFDKTDSRQPVRIIFGGNEGAYDWPTKWRFIRRP